MLKCIGFYSIGYFYARTYQIAEYNILLCQKILDYFAQNASDLQNAQFIMPIFSLIMKLGVEIENRSET